MGRPLGGKNIMRTPEEKEEILKEYMEGKISIRAIAKKHSTSQSKITYWLRDYREKGIEGLKSKTGKHHNPNIGKYNRHPSEIDKLKQELLKKEIEIERLKKGYQVKGVGAKKEYVTTFDMNMK